ncbi:MAG: hypothetical protein MR536_04360 [Prevotella sp.]|nr:hypothetical protein [Prevotella sp.]
MSRTKLAGVMPWGNVLMSLRVKRTFRGTRKELVTTFLDPNRHIKSYNPITSFAQPYPTPPYSATSSNTLSSYFPIINHLSPEC